MSVRCLHCRCRRSDSSAAPPASAAPASCPLQCGIQDCRNAFCSGQVTTADNKLLIFGGHGNALDLTAARSYDHSTGRVQSTKMQSGRWYPTT